MKQKITARKWWALLDDFMMMGYDEPNAIAMINMDYYCIEMLNDSPDY